MEAERKEIWTNGKTTVWEIKGRIYIESVTCHGERYTVKTYLTRKWFSRVSCEPSQELHEMFYNDMTLGWGLGSEESEAILDHLFNDHFREEIEKCENQYYTEICQD